LERNAISPDPPIQSRDLTTTIYSVNSLLTNSSSIMLSNPSSHSQTPSPKRTKCTLHHYSPRELGKWAKANSRLLAKLGWDNFVYYHQRPHSMHPDLSSIPHPTAQYLHDMACTGAPNIIAKPPWPSVVRDQVYQRGPQVSAAKHHAQFLIEDMFDYVQMGYWVVLPYQAVRLLCNLRLAPASVVPQKERRPRPIMDYSFYRTNQSCHLIAPFASIQFGGTLQRLLQCIVYCNPSHGPPLLAKVDLLDGYYRIPLSPEASLHLAMLIPSDILTEPSLIALPLTLPMGWSHSPPYFCAYTETIADIANTHQPRPEHPLLNETQCCSLPQHRTFHPTATVLGSPTAPP
jgi:hypothetical protein